MQGKAAAERVTPQIVPSDYDADPTRFLRGREAAKRFGSRGDVHEDVATRFANEGVRLALDVGSADGTLARLLRGFGVSCVSLDRSRPLLGRAPGLKVLGDAARLPFADASFSAVGCLYVLYHVQDPLVAISEAFRVLTPGGLFAAATVARWDSPELPEAPKLGGPVALSTASKWIGEARRRGFLLETRPGVAGGVPATDQKRRRKAAGRRNGRGNAKSK